MNYQYKKPINCTLICYKKVMYKGIHFPRYIKYDSHKCDPRSTKEVQGAGHGFDGEDSGMARKASIAFIKLLSAENPLASADGMKAVFT